MDINKLISSKLDPYRLFTFDVFNYSSSDYILNKLKKIYKRMNNELFQ